MSNTIKVLLAVMVACTVIPALYSSGSARELALLRAEHNILKEQVQLLTALSENDATTLNGDRVKQSVLDTLDAVQLRPNFLGPEMAEVIKNRADEGDIVFLSADYPYREILWNWITVAESKNISNWIVSCYDDELKAWLEERGSTCHIQIPKAFTKLSVKQNEILENRHCIGQTGFVMEASSMKECIAEGCPRFYNTDCLAVQYTRATKQCYKCVGDPRTDFVSALPEEGTDLALFSPRHRLWHLRWLGAMDVFALGLNVVFIDLDAIVVQNFFPLIRSIESDAIAQRDFGPNKAVAVWGSSLCMGFSYWKTGTLHRQEIIKNINAILEKSGDDQSAVANALMIEGVRFPEKLKTSDTRPITGSSPSGYQLTMLPLNTFARKCRGRMAPPHYIAHCVFGGNARHKKWAIGKLGGWKLRPDYETVKYSDYASFKEYITDMVKRDTPPPNATPIPDDAGASLEVGEDSSLSESSSDVE